MALFPNDSLPQQICLAEKLLHTRSGWSSHRLSARKSLTITYFSAGIHSLQPLVEIVGIVYIST